MDIINKTVIGSFIGNEKDTCLEFLGITYATSKRFEYSKIIEKYADNYDATKPKPACMQKRAWSEFEHLDVPERAFYHKEFRDGINFEYSEDDCLNLNIYTPKTGENHPTIVYFHGGGFDSGSINERPFKGDEIAKRNCVIVFASYRVGIFGYFTHEDIYKENNRDGNFGLDDMMNALLWVRKNISYFKGDPNNITVMGQSAGAMSIQYLLCSKKADTLFDKAIMLSGAGLFPKFSLPRKCENTREYWLEVMNLCNCSTLSDFKNASAYDLLLSVEKQKALRKDNTYNTMPVIDNYMLEDGIDKLIKKARNVPLIIGFTNNDMFTYLLAHISKKYAKEHSAYLFYFDIDAKGDNNQAFHSSELNYVFGTLSTSWRPYDEHDYYVSNVLMDYISQFAKTGNPNKENLPKWDVYKNKPLCFSDKTIEMAKPNNSKLLKNTLKGDPT